MFHLSLSNGINELTYVVCCIFIRIVDWVLGSAVVVERIFSGGQDTISLHRASLKPETITVLMLVKHRLILKHQLILQHPSAQHD